MSRTLKIDKLGAQGDGIADTDTGPVFVPFSLPGETVEVVGSGKRLALQAVRETSPDRISPACTHFGACGGCSLQHLEHGMYLEWKHDRVASALKRAGIDIEPEPIIACEPQTRRRAVFSARNLAAGPVLGFNEAAGNTIVEVTECPVLVPEITEALPRLRALAALFGKASKPIRMTVSAAKFGLDVDISGVEAVSDKIRREMSAFAVEAGFARVSVDGEIIIEPRKPTVTFGETTVALPTGGFLQATAETESEMANLVCNHLAKAKRIIDLFAGSGAFALRLARSSVVHAVESEAQALSALDTGFRFASGLKTVTHERRDLFRRPVTALELKKFNGLVFDPPRAGAEDQACAVAKSDVRHVAAVSCNPVTLARDLKILIDGGYRLRSITPIDQFLWSPHVEAVALLERPKRRP